MNLLTILYLSFPLSKLFTNVLMSVENCGVGNLRVRSVKKGKEKKKMQGSLYFSVQSLIFLILSPNRYLRCRVYIIGNNTVKCLHKVQRWFISKETAATCGFTCLFIISGFLIGLRHCLQNCLNTSTLQDLGTIYSETSAFSTMYYPGILL